ncbi:thiolase family protein [Streptomyces collinus]|uniref:thiolase family protein n=1 Tax=Streptomyces collinus TaxID=42684 RepID=UPI0036C4893E
MRDAVVVQAVRTPIGKGRPQGALASVHPVDLLAHALRTLIDRSGLEPLLVDEVIGGCVEQVGEQAKNTVRWGWLAAGLPEAVPATTVDRQCASSQQAVHLAVQGVLSGAHDIAIACGVESMSRVPMGSHTPPGTDFYGPAVRTRYRDGLPHQGISAELVAAKWSITREHMDSFAADSHRKAAAATQGGLFADELVAVPASAGLIDHDESIRPSTTFEALSGLRPVFADAAATARYPQINWSVTAGNSSPLSDGASAVLITSSATAARLGLRPMARLHSCTAAGADPRLMLTATIPATQKVLSRAGLHLSDIDLFEVSEAFASVVLAWLQETGADPAKVNVNGGAIALGHPVGASGTRILATLVHAMRQRNARYALQTMCAAGGLANATVLESMS